MHTTQDTTRTARLAGVFYLGMAITAALGFIVIRQQVFVADNPAETLANLLAHDSLARAGIALELAMVVFQALAAAWFYRLFCPVDSFAASGIAAFGLVNTVVTLVSTALLATAVHIPSDAATVQVLYVISYSMWEVGALFFGLWLLPMGWCVLRSGWMPRPLGWTLLIGGVCYLTSPFILYLVPNAKTLFEIMAIPASIGEFWMVGYLLIRGVRQRTPQQA
ncbi:DUF4386 domain-containing protein [Actinokineospora diospyrosa]|uniref:DUF4386 domain-containing protein n=1 Tax=Actinokineospora diospyrosa TaxID=103728 RepID=A0ABT1IDX8_9PSEU|nr:DUF4386 domain-containing protein [Actinokineospora diospyrosa]MCP2270851.1 protein of unknown function (DUF4386) [Actinokineospora diospyrosa]